MYPEPGGRRRRFHDVLSPVGTLRGGLELLVEAHPLVRLVIWRRTMRSRIGDLENLAWNADQTSVGLALPQLAGGSPPVCAKSLQTIFHTPSIRASRK